MESAFRDGAVPSSDTAITRILPPTSKFGAGGDYVEVKNRVLSRLKEFLERFLGLSADGDVLE